MLQFFAYPVTLMDIPVREDRGTIRVYLDGLGYAMVSYFMCLHLFYQTNKAKYFILALIFFIPVYFWRKIGFIYNCTGTIVQLLFSGQS